MEIKRCPICQGQQLSLIFQIAEYPYVGYCVSVEEKERILKEFSKSELFSTLKIMGCRICKHAFQAMGLNKRLMNVIYSECYNYPSPMLTGFAQEREKIFLNFFSNNIVQISKEKGLNRVLEIACYDGYILNELSKMGYKVFGCDPSKGADIAKDFGIKVFKQFFDSNYFMNRGEFFNVIIFRHFIEHAHDPINLLIDVSKILTNNGLIIFETPNVEYYLENGSFETFGFQHLQNFSIHSVIETLRRASLGLIDYKATPENLLIVASKKSQTVPAETSPWERLAAGFESNLRKNVQNFRRWVKPYLDQKKKIALWGAGGFCGYFFPLYGADEGDISYVVDIDKRKWDMCFMDKDLNIYPPEKLIHDTVDLIIITSMYSREIIRQINEMKIKADVISLHPDVHYLPSPAA